MTMQLGGTLGGAVAAMHVNALSGRAAIPTFEVELTPLGNFRFKCPHCKRWHMHGGGGGLGHRSAHCEHNDSPWKWSGYYLALKGGRQ